jgi:hypothetical protein
MIPAKADPEKQKEFLEQEIQPRLAAAQAGKRVVLFVDARVYDIMCKRGTNLSRERMEQT